MHTYPKNGLTVRRKILDGAKFLFFAGMIASMKISTCEILDMQSFAENIRGYSLAGKHFQMPEGDDVLFISCLFLVPFQS